MNSEDSRRAGVRRRAPNCRLDEHRIVRLARCDAAQETASRRLLDGYLAVDCWTVTPQDPPANDNVDGRHSARHGLMSCPDPITLTPNPTPPPSPSAAPAHQPAAELDSENPT